MPIEGLTMQILGIIKLLGKKIGEFRVQSQGRVLSGKAHKGKN